MTIEAAIVGETLFLDEEDYEEKQIRGTEAKRRSDLYVSRGRSELWLR